MFNWRKAGWKVLRLVAIVAAAFGVTIAIPESFEEFMGAWLQVIIMAVVGLIELARQIRKHWDKFSAVKQ